MRLRMHYMGNLGDGLGFQGNEGVGFRFFWFQRKFIIYELKKWDHVASSSNIVHDIPFA
jgi:hypothetical protein